MVLISIVSQENAVTWAQPMETKPARDIRIPVYNQMLSIDAYTYTYTAIAAPAAVYMLMYMLRFWVPKFRYTGAAAPLPTFCDVPKVLNLIFI